MKVITKLFLIPLIIFFSNVNLGSAQNANSMGDVIGNKAPQEIIHLLEKNGADLNKPTIINFWATWCLPCIREIKYLDSLMNESAFLNIISISYEDEAIVKSFLEKHQDLKNSKLKFLAADTIGIKYFPYRQLPHNVWIDSSGIVKYITGGDYITKENLIDFANNKNNQFDVKVDVLDFDPFEPFHLRDSSFLYRSILTKSVEGILSGVTVFPEGNFANRKISRVFFFNRSLSNMIWWALSKGMSGADYYNRMRVVTSDSLQYYWPSSAPISFKSSKYKTKEQWIKENAYCYEIDLKKARSDSLVYSFILDDLKRNFDFEIDVKKDSMICSIITLKNNELITSSHGPDSYLELTNQRLVAKNVTVLYLMDYLNEKVKKRAHHRPLDPPYIDKTNGAKIDVNIDFDSNGLPDYGQLKKMLKEKYGINVQHRMHEYNIHIVKDLDK